MSTTSTARTHLCLVGLLAPAWFGLVGCSSGRLEEGRSDAPARATASADPLRHTDPAHKTIRPIPDVISRPKPFRLPDVVGAVPSLEPVTMKARGDLAGAVRPAAVHAPAALDFPAGPARPLAATVADAGPAVAEVSTMLREYLQAFNRHDSAALASHWSESGENVDLDSGETTRGRAAVERVFASLFEQDVATTIDLDIESIRPLRDDVAVVDGVTRISFTDDEHARRGSGSRFSAVVVKQNGRWMLESVREAALANAGAPATAQPKRPLDAIAWLVGSWEDVGEGVTAGTHCFWSAGRAFLVRSHVVTFDAPAAGRPAAGDAQIPDLLPPGAGAGREITEIIGWDPEREQIRSWIFTSDGRFAEAAWTPEGDGWLVRFEGRGTDAAATASCLIKRVGPDEVSIRCDSDALADVMPPACEFVRTARLEMAP